MPTPSTGCSTDIPQVRSSGPRHCNPRPFVPAGVPESGGTCFSACRRERAEVAAACRRGPRAPLLSAPCPAGPLAASGCPQLARGGRRALPVRLTGSGARGRVRRCLRACGSCHGSCSGIGAGGGDSVCSPIYLAVCFPFPRGKGAGTRLFGFLCAELSCWAPS